VLEELLAARIDRHHSCWPRPEPRELQPERKFSPANLSVNQVDTIAVKDATTGTPHTFTIEGKGVDVVNDAGQTQTVTIDLPPGTYPFICRFHSSLGMKGTLTVK
jgi:plastocyanin